MQEPIDMHELLAALVGHETLDEDRSFALFEAILAGGVPPEQIAAALALVQQRGVTVDELVGGARAMRQHVTPVPASADDTRPLIDTCGTGGAPKTFNVSTAAALVAAGTGLCRVCKHGNRSRTGRGSAEVLQGLGVNIDAAPETQARCLDEVGVCFSFAMRHHPAMVHAAGPRKMLGFPTVFNLLGPLTNPAGAARQLVGVYDATLAERVAHTLARLGCERAMVVHSDDGLDELSIAAPTSVWTVEGGGVSRSRVQPEDAGLERTPLDRVRAESVEHAAAIIRSVCAGEPGPHRAMTELSAAAALVVAGAFEAIAEAHPAVTEAIDRGNALRTLEALAARSRDRD